MAADFSPTMKGYSGVKPFRAWVQMVLPQVYSDALSYQELVYKMLWYLKSLIEDVEACEGNIDSLLEAYQKLEDYCNNYFANLDVTEEISTKLDEMVTTGELKDIVEDVLNDMEDELTALTKRVSTAETNINTLTDNYNETYTVVTQLLINVATAQTSIKSLQSSISSLAYILDLSSVSDVGSAINSALETYYEVHLIPGEYESSTQIVIPNCRILDGNNSSITYTGTGDFAVKIGTNTVREPDVDENNMYSNHKCELKNLTVNCNSVSGGVRIVCRGARVYDVKVVNVESSHYGVQIDEPTSGGTNSDAVLENVSINNQTTPYAIGFAIYGDDNRFIRCDTYRAIVGAYIEGGSPYFTNCHFLAMDSASYASSWVNSIGWHYTTTGRAVVNINDCYADNYKVALKCEGSARMNVSLNHYFWEYSNSDQRYGILVASDIYGIITLTMPNTKNYIGLNFLTEGITGAYDISKFINCLSMTQINCRFIASYMNRDDQIGINKPYELPMFDGNAQVSSEYGYVVGYLPLLYGKDYLYTSGTISAFNFKIDISCLTSGTSENQLCVWGSSEVRDTTGYDVTVNLCKNSVGDYLICIDTNAYMGVTSFDLYGLYLTLPHNLAGSTLDLTPTQLISTVTLS